MFGSTWPEGLAQVLHQISQQLCSQYWPRSTATRQYFWLLSCRWDRGKLMPFSFARWLEHFSFLAQLTDATALWVNLYMCLSHYSSSEARQHRRTPVPHTWIFKLGVESAAFLRTDLRSLHQMFHHSWIPAIRCFKLTILDLIAWLLCYLHPNAVFEIILQAN